MDQLLFRNVNFDQASINKESLQADFRCEMVNGRLWAEARIFWVAIIGSYREFALTTNRKTQL